MDKKIFNDNDSKRIMLLKKAIKTEKITNTGSAFNVYRKFQDRLEINDQNDHVCHPL